MLVFIFFLTINVYALNEMATPEEAQGIASAVRDLEVEELLRKTQEFQSCRAKYQFDAKDDQPKRTDKLRKAQECIKDKISRGNPDLKKLSESLGLQSFGLVKGTTVTEIQQYLNDKMYKELTGVDPKEEDLKKKIEMLKFKNKKQIDQSLFFELYKTQLSKGALYEISRFCFQNLRLDNTPVNNKSFGEYWSGFNGKNPYKLKDVTDEGKPEDFGSISDPTNKTTIFDDIFNGIKINQGSSLPTAYLKDFFMWCGGMIVPLCNDFKDKNPHVSKTTDTTIESAIPDTPKPGAGSGTPPSAMTKGAEACLTKNRLQGIRAALIDLDKVTQKMRENYEVPPEYLAKLLRAETINLYIPGENGASSLDDLTNVTSSDIMSGTKDTIDGASDCEKSLDWDKCKNFFVDSESVERAKQRVELEMTAAREVEMARVRKALATSQQKLEDYLKEEGMFDILEKYKNNPNINVEEEVGKELEARKLSTLQAIQNKMGKRQAGANDAATIKDNARPLVSQTKEEKARLAQVVLFNNIITSSLELTRPDGSKAGQNISGWLKEEKELKKASINPSLFSNLQITNNGSNKGPGANEQIQGLGLIEEILGAPKNQNPNSPGASGTPATGSN